MVQRSDILHQSNDSDSTVEVENKPVLTDESSIYIAGNDSERSIQISNQNMVDSYPDGGLRAWLVVAGVRLLFPIVTPKSYPPFLGNVYYMWDVSIFTDSHLQHYLRLVFFIVRIP